MLGLDNPIHIAFLFVLLLLVFGAKRLPELGRSLGVGHARLQGVDHRRGRGHAARGGERRRGRAHAGRGQPVAAQRLEVAPGAGWCASTYAGI